jgi:hypothetical protein
VMVPDPGGLGYLSPAPLTPIAADSGRSSLLLLETDRNEVGRKHSWADR